MFIKIIVLYFLSASTLGSPIGERIVNGTDADPGEYPYVISLRYYGSHNCGGSILNEEFILTAAHCVDGYQVSSLSVQYGTTLLSSGVNVINVSKAIAHEDFVPGNGYLNDVAVLKLETPLTFGPTVQPVRLPPAFNATPENALAELVGWGLPYSGGLIMNHLQKVNITVYPDEECERLHNLTGPTKREYHICAGVPEGGKGQCSGDSGGPLTVKEVEVGIVSWSVKPCTVQGYPGVFTKVSRHIDWIHEQMAKNSD